MHPNPAEPTHFGPLQPGWPHPLGAQVVADGVNFAVMSEHATRMELCLFDASGQHELQRLSLFGPHNGIFHGHLPGAAPGLVYGLRAHGPYAPHQGHRFNPHKLLLDPYAREIVGRFAWVPQQHGYVAGHADGPWSQDSHDNAAVALKARVAAPSVPVSMPTPRRRPADLVLYEVHVKGFSMTHPGVPVALRGTYAGLAHPASIAHFKSLGVTTLSLLPVHYPVHEGALVVRGSSNYWGYNTLGFFCPNPDLAQSPHDPTAANAEFRAMVDALHAAGLEVVLDVVYNHTAEGSEWGTTVSFRGLDNATWYRHAPNDLSHCENLTGCGNTLNVAHPKVTQFVLDSLRYWVQHMGVDGFRFDLATVLGRTAHGYDSNAAFFVALLQDPVLAGVHLIAEPWDAGPDGYHVGRFPGRFMDWNDRFRDAVRGYWLQRGTRRGEFAQRFMASSDLFMHSQRQPTASVNFVTAHDGFTLRDVVSYNHKHNHANGENNADGRDTELCANQGEEGPSLDASIRGRRQRLIRAMLATLLLAQGTPMLCAGDEIGKTQQGNNNAYCQDNTLSWLDWRHPDMALQALVQRLTALRSAEPRLHHAHWHVPKGQGGPGPHVSWLAPHGHELTPSDWQDEHGSAFACLMDAWPNAFGPAAANSRLLIAFNPTAQPVHFGLPELGTQAWRLELDSSDSLEQNSNWWASVPVPAHSLAVLRQPIA